MNPISASDSQDRQESGTGSPSSGEPVFLVVGRLRRPHGIEGEVILEVITDFPERLRRGLIVFMGDQHIPLRIRTRREHDRFLLLSFEGYEDRDQIGQLRNQLIYVRTVDLPPLPEGEFYHHQLFGLNVLDEQGQLLGTLEQILETGANDVYLVRTPEGSEILLPAIKDVVLSVNLEQKEIRVRPPEWA